MKDKNIAFLIVSVGIISGIVYYLEKKPKPRNPIRMYKPVTQIEIANKNQ